MADNVGMSKMIEAEMLHYLASYINAMHHTMQSYKMLLLLFVLLKTFNFVSGAILSKLAKGLGRTLLV